MDQSSLNFMSQLMIIAAGCTFISSFLLEAPYGRYVKSSERFFCLSPTYAWLLMESPNLIVCCIGWRYRDANLVGNIANMTLIAMFCAHYVQRSILYPMLINHAAKPVPLLIALSGFAFCTVNSFIQIRAWTALISMPEHWTTSLSFWLGIILFIAGMAINIHSDGILRKLRKSANGASDYVIPRGGLFDYVSAANYFGEILEWFGYFLASNGSLPAFAFFLFSACYLGPRGYAHHQFYVKTFKSDYPKNRKAIIPFVL